MTGLSRNASAKKTAPGERLRGGAVLFADDDESALTVGALMLERLGFEALTARDGAEAVEIFRRRADEIVCTVLDLTMPEMDGEEALGEIRKVRPDAPIILTSGYRQEDVSERLADSGISGFLQKPFVCETLGEMIRQVLAGPPGPAPSE